MYMHAAENLMRSADGLSMDRSRITIVTQYPEIMEYADRQGLKALLNPEPERGISSSLKIGLRENIAAKACLFSVADQPGLTSLSIERLVKEFKGSSSGIACLRSGDRQGNPCIFASKYYRDLLALEGDRGGKTVLRAHPEDVCFTEVLPGELEDMDYPPEKASCSP